jgi:hypothetical protein
VREQRGVKRLVKTWKIVEAKIAGRIGFPQYCEGNEPTNEDHEKKITTK